MLKRIISIVLLSLVLSSSSFSLSQYLINCISKNTYSEDQLNFAVQLKLKVAQEIMIKQSESGTSQWLDLAALLSRKDPQYSWLLTTYFRHQNDTRNYNFWFQQALKQGFYLAKLAQAEKLDKQQNYQQAKRLIRPLTHQYPEAIALATRLAIKNGDMTFLKAMKAKLDTKQHSQLLADIKRYQIVDDQTDNTLKQVVDRFKIGGTDTHLGDRAKIGRTGTHHCKNPIQFFASSLAQLLSLDKVLDQIQQQAFFKQQFCFHKPRYISPKKLNCQHTDNQAIQCDETIWKYANIYSDIKYLGVLAPKGNANVNHGILYIDETDSQQVIEHELLHLVGFIDEYPLPKRHSACDLVNGSESDLLVVKSIAKNVVVSNNQVVNQKEQLRSKVLKLIPWAHLIKPDTPIFQQTNFGWRIGTPSEFQAEVGLFASLTCGNHKNVAFKPITAVSKLQHFEQAVPNIYLDEKINQGNSFNMPSYHYNIALAHRDEKNQQQAKNWFEKAASYEINIERQHVVSQGVF